jgi:hypothetical protein
MLKQAVGVALCSGQRALKLVLYTVTRLLNTSYLHQPFLVIITTHGSSIMISPLHAFGALVLSYIGFSTLQLIYNYRKAKAIGLPVLITPIDPVRY